MLPGSARRPLFRCCGSLVKAWSPWLLRRRLAGATALEGGLVGCETSSRPLTIISPGAWQVTSHTSLLEGPAGAFGMLQATLRHKLDLRTPYITPLNILQAR